jgi:hypothetical protein
VTRAAVLRDSAITSGIGQFAVIQYVAPSVGVEVSPVDVRDPSEIERGVAAFARSGNGGLIVTGSPLSLVHRDLIITLAARHKLPEVYFLRPFCACGAFGAICDFAKALGPTFTASRSQNRLGGLVGAFTLLAPSLPERSRPSGASNQPVWSEVRQPADLPVVTGRQC